MLFERFISKQLGHPNGVFSGLVAAFMNRSTSLIGDVTIQLLEIKPTDHILDIGFGGGKTIRKMVKLAPNGLVAGIDISDAMLKRGNKSFRELISKGKVEIKEGSVSKIPFEDNQFEKVSTVNTIFFWPEPAVGMMEIIRVLKPKGRLVLTYFTREMFHWTQYGVKMYPEEQLSQFLSQAGFIDIEVKHIEHPLLPAALIRANKHQ
jgi:ubiquinone/menaquinone biosynthesis C-methylase UbiE